MKNTTLILTLLAAALVPLTASAQKSKNDPRIAYVLPAGGQQGSTVEVLVVGFRLNGITNAVISGDGVHVKLLKVFPPIRPINGEQRKRLREALISAAQQLKEKGKAAPPPKLPLLKDGKPDPEDIPSQPLLDKLEDPTMEDLQRITYEYFVPRQRLSRNAAFSTSVLLEVTIDRDATPGDRELRLISQQGLTHPMYFQVGTTPEIQELEPNDPDNLPESELLKTPIVINGQIRPGDVDCFRFHATRGQNLIISAQARRLVPYLADAVPGWFEAVVTLYDPNGKEVDFSDCYRFNPDPILLHRITRTGDYLVEIHDSIYRGREDFVYRLSIGRHPLVTGVMPLGGREGKPLEVSLDGENLSAKTLKLDTSPDKGRFRQAHFIGKQWCPYAISYAADALPECVETDQNDTRQTAQKVSIPTIINGTINQPGDADWFQFKGSEGQTIVAEVVARQLNSPLDSLIQLTDASGKELAWNDDFERPNIGLKTHHADSYLSMTLPKSGVYFVHIRDTREHGDPAYGYRLRISEPQPDFMVYVTPSSVNVPSGRMVPVRFQVLRKDGFDGPIEIRTAKGTSDFTLQGATIPAGQNEVTCTLATTAKESELPVPLQLEACFKEGEQEVIRPVVPVDDWEQAFIYEHLVPAEELMVAVTKIRGAEFKYRLTGPNPVHLKADQKTTVRLESNMPPYFGKQIEKSRKQFKLTLVDPPKGIRLVGTKVEPDHLELVIQVDSKAMGDGETKVSAGNLVVEVLKETTANKDKRKTSWPVGILPLIPFEIMEGK